MQTADARLVQLFAASGRPLMYERGDTIIRAGEGEPVSEVFMIVHGWVQMYGLSRAGEPNVVMCLHAGDIMPLNLVLSGNSGREESFSALETTRAIRIQKDYLMKVIQDDSQIGLLIARKLNDYCERLSSELINMPHRSARERVAYRLVSLAGHFAEPGSDRALLRLRISNEFLARSTNMTRETASREVSWLTKRGYIKRDNGYIAINSLSALKQEVGKDFQWFALPAGTKPLQKAKTP